MNNAANNIDAQSKSLKSMLFERHYKVGYFQREYKWQRTHIEDLLIDLERSFNSNWHETHTQQDVANYARYYMGPVVLYMEQSVYSVVDGQQRLTSFVLLMIYLNYKYREILDIQNKYQGYIYSEYYGISAYNMNIAEREKVLDAIYKNDIIDETVLQNESCKTILERYGDIMELFPEGLLRPEIFPLFTTWLTEKLVFIEIMTQTSESAYTIFETMNDRGLNLTQTELLKSFLLSNVKDEIKIKELDAIWKNKISMLNAVDDDQDFFKAWLRAKYAVTIRANEKSSENKDFEKIGTRFSSWTQENTKYRDGTDSLLLLDTKDSNSFYYFVKSDFDFYSNLYLKLKGYEHSDALPEPRFKLLTYKGVSHSLAYPLILSPIRKVDDEEIIHIKLKLSTNYLDSFAVYRMLLGEPITHSTIRNTMYSKAKDIRNFSVEELQLSLSSDINTYKKRFLQEDYTVFDHNSRYILARLFKNKQPGIEFETLYFQRRKESFVLYQILKAEDFESDKYGLPKGLKDRLIHCLCCYTLVPRSIVNNLDSLSLIQRIPKIIQLGYLLEQQANSKLDLSNLKTFL
ncbi:DUF262 domain-containing protein [Hymenobacter sp. APR13]|uniref:DUF262 domain-containing protein n=1 Tax=Hymenobacter sp. APR13 TaxID=1356852 RepID=UPI0009005116|nr:DUF262 domain-containing protein [Hymenobacter sp. APR13]